MRVLRGWGTLRKFLGRFHMCRMGQSEGNCFKHWNILRSSVVFDCPNRSLWLGLQMVIIRIKI